MNRSRRLSGLALLLCAAAVPAADHLWLLGGGADVYSSQAQIEANVLWALRAQGQLPGERALHLYFTDGTDPAPDVVEWHAPADGPETLQPLARVFDSYWSNGEHYRNHRIPDVTGGTEAAGLVDALGEGFRGLRPGDRAWLVFNGHGGLAEDRNNSIELWSDTRLTVDDLAAQLGALPERVTFRFLFTQCYAGGFARLAETGEGRCGFLAEAADREAEGCSAAVDRAGWEDYSTHFFAALTGRERDGSALSGDPDRDRDGRVSPLEAHWHTLARAYSSDIPRATSEVLLEGWEPWHLPATQRAAAPADNPYMELARELMAQAGIAADGGDPERAIEARVERLSAEREALERERRALEEATGRRREALAAEVLRRWPRAGYGHTLNYLRFLERDLPDAQAFILGHPDYPSIEAGQDAWWAQDERLLDNERALTRLEKIEHLRRLARKRAVLERFGPQALRERYSALVRCESEPF